MLRGDKGEGEAMKNRRRGRNRHKGRQSGEKREKGKERPMEKGMKNMEVKEIS